MVGVRDGNFLLNIRQDSDTDPLKIYKSVFLKLALFQLPCIEGFPNISLLHLDNKTFI